MFLLFAVVLVLIISFAYKSAKRKAKKREENTRYRIVVDIMSAESDSIIE